LWYTPPEIMCYIVARVDTALWKELDIADSWWAEPASVSSSVLLHRRLSSGNATLHRRAFAGQRRRCDAGEQLETGGDDVSIWFRDHACAIRGRAFAVGLTIEKPGCATR
jgi:hypothetical protein